MTMSNTFTKVSRAISAWVIEQLPILIITFSSLILACLSLIAIYSTTLEVRAVNNAKGEMHVNTIRSELISEFSGILGALEQISPPGNGHKASTNEEAIFNKHLNELIKQHPLITTVDWNPFKEIHKINDPHQREIAKKSFDAKTPTLYLDQGRALLAMPGTPHNSDEATGLFSLDINLASIVNNATTKLNSQSNGHHTKITLINTTANATQDNNPLIPTAQATYYSAFNLPSPLTQKLELEHTIPTLEERKVVIQRILTYALATLLAWVVFITMAQWVETRYVVPLRKITAIAHKINAQNEVGSNSPSDVVDYSAAIEKLQISLQGFVDVLNNTEDSYQEKIQISFDELNQTKERLEQVANSGGIIVLSVDLVNGQLNYATNSLTQYLREINAPASPQNWIEIYNHFKSGDRRRIREAIRNAHRNGKSQLQVGLGNQYIHRIFDLRFQLTAATAGRHPKIVCIAIDNTEKAAVEQALMRSEQRKAAVINGALDGFITMTTDFIITEVNPAAERMHGSKNIDLLGKHYLDFCIAEHSKKQFSTYYNHLLDEHSNLENEEKTIWCRQANGTVFPVAMGGSVVHTEGGQQVCLYLKDLTRTFAQQKSIESKTAEIEAILSMSPGGIASFPEDGILSSHNKALWDMLGLDPKDFTNSISHDKFWELIKLLSHQPDNKKVEQLLDEGEHAFIVHSPKQKLIKCAQRIPPGHEDGESRVYYFSDITQEFQLDAMKSNFLATAAHELRTPLTTILGFTELLITQKINEKDQKDLLNSIFRQSKNLSALINDLLDLSKIESDTANVFKYENSNILHTITRLYQQSSAPKNDKRFINNHEFTLEIVQSESLMVYMDEEKIRRAIENLISNAVKYSPENAPIALTVDTTTVHQQAFVKISITDQGIGMTPDEVEHAFVRFWRADSSSGKIPGTGLGLPLVKEIIDMHKGSVQLYSEFQAGTTACILLPITQEISPVSLT